MGVLTDPTARYTALEAWAYDRVVAPAVTDLVEHAAAELLPRLPRHGRLLDVGCGGGQMALALAERRPDLRVIGLDLAPSQVARAAARGRDRGVPVPFVIGSALDLPFADASVDGVLSLGSIKHWPDMARGLRECVRVLRPGGTLAVGDADRGCRMEDVRAFVSRWRIPGVLRPLGVAFFRTAVSGPSFDLDDARALLAALPLAGAEVRRIAGMPALMLIGERAA